MVENNEKMYLELLDFDTDKKEKWVKQRLPYSVLFELTARCNMNCVHCYLQNVHDTKELSYDKIIEIIDILYEKGIVFLTFTGGEILLRKDFVDIYLYAKKKGFLVELFTNGYLFDDKIIDALAEYPPLLVDISLYGASENTYRKVTGLQNAFARVIQNCKKLKKVVLAEGTEKIVDKQFYGCKNLTTINIPKSVKIIEKNAFKGCTKLKL